MFFLVCFWVLDGMVVFWVVLVCLGFIGIHSVFVVDFVFVVRIFNSFARFLWTFTRFLGPKASFARLL